MWPWTRRVKKAQELGWEGNDLVLVRTTVRGTMRWAPVLTVFSPQKRLVAHTAQWISFSECRGHTGGSSGPTLILKGLHWVLVLI